MAKNASKLLLPRPSKRKFEQLATTYEYSSTSGAERTYKKIVDRLTGLLVDAGVLGVVELKLTDKNKKSPPLHTSTKQYIGMPTTTMNGEKSVLTFLRELLRSQSWQTAI